MIEEINATTPIPNYEPLPRNPPVDLNHPCPLREHHLVRPYLQILLVPEAPLDHHPYPLLDYLALDHLLKRRLHV
ncbi:MAG: hypothetical protein L6R41_002720 [Letrouitia leprolyta]|nr:MAG: hypothetical protein L6R41_002720 [Letrouitia leprolyta]